MSGSESSGFAVQTIPTSIRQIYLVIEMKRWAGRIEEEEEEEKQREQRGGEEKGEEKGEEEEEYSEPAPPTQPSLVLAIYRLKKATLRCLQDYYSADREKKYLHFQKSVVYLHSSKKVPGVDKRQWIQTNFLHVRLFLKTKNSVNLTKNISLLYSILPQDTLML